MFTIRPKYKNKVVGFNGSAAPLGERDDFAVLAEIAVNSQDPSLLILFNKTPTAEDVKKFKTQKFMKEEKEGDKNE
ncbi:hypothetical protein C1637_09975 [Chryseobacterium lactis]|uniref:Phage protein n=1 Tax=Chryseobacterium lactis TaxID=1241981 RepID=A0A3G6RBW6_CHRLC|nr:hypothetical protein [Chryseobacterium lactis]AZA82161.1 hypothetical protein EG342_09720 [Chryseobacterium lactis]AZB02542.1 hypothetical protein EG341_00575 [Chryseobacterium lactis]PNW14162.1 hypothetical protein C1637_09975 [Chryseobacterium lactis]